MHPGKHISQPITPISGNRGLDLSTYGGWAHLDDRLFARVSPNVVRHFDSWYLDDKGSQHQTSPRTAWAFTRNISASRSR